MTKKITVEKVNIGGDSPLVLIAGPCVIESEKITMETAQAIKKITEKLKIDFIFKSSYDKANRTAVDNYRGPGLEKGLKILAKVKKEFNIPVVSDIHAQDQIQPAAQVLDIIQIPAYLCQQTDLAVEAGKANKVVNLKKGQFLAPWDMKKICAKVESTGNKNIILTERGTVFGYNNLVADMRSIPLMQEIGYPVVVDITHIVRMPGPSSSEASGGQPQFIASLARASVGAGCDGLFLEVHPNPKEALCDAASMLHLDYLEDLLTDAIAINKIVKRRKL
jgi:2-dehydro-3-deoxyphosphooctonate aldolase (KDO 8-P synthase)